LATENYIRRPDRLLLVCDVAGRVLCDHCYVADGPISRMRGLLGRRSLAAGEGLLLRPASAIHTAFMHFSIDAIFLDRDAIVLRIAHDLAPWRAASRHGARQVLELPADTARSRGIEPGDRLRFISPRDATSREIAVSLPPRKESQAERAYSASLGAVIAAAVRTAGPMARRPVGLSLATPALEGRY
jgi:uncharacterized membrane protein (UPF0127 family)